MNHAQPIVHPLCTFLLNNLAEHTGLPASLICGADRRAHIVDARHALAAVLCDHMRMSLTEIGKFMGKDHTTISHLLVNRKENWQVKQHIDFLNNLLLQEKVKASVNDSRLIRNMALESEIARILKELILPLQAQINALQDKIGHHDSVIGDTRAAIYEKEISQAPPRVGKQTTIRGFVKKHRIPEPAGDTMTPAENRARLAAHAAEDTSRQAISLAPVRGIDTPNSP